MPIRIKAVHIVNQPYIFNMLFAIFKPFMREKLRSRIHFHGTDRRSLLSHIDARATRKRHGGDLSEPEIPGQTLWHMLQHYEEDFKGICSYMYLKAQCYKVFDEDGYSALVNARTNLLQV